MPVQIRLPEQNHVLLTGRLTRDPEVRYTQKGQAVARLDVALNRRYKDASSGEWKDDTVFVKVTAWGPAAERCKEKLVKGSPVCVEGRLTMEEWTDKAGQRRTNLVVTSRRLQFLAVSDKNQQNSKVNSTTDTSKTADEGTLGNETATDLDDVPF
jgi:single-strand DNA-binding protein